MKRLCVVAGIALIFGRGVLAVDIVVNGQAKMGIVVPASATDAVQEAAKEMQTYLQKSTGATLPIAEEGSAPPGPAIWIGPTKRGSEEGLPVAALKPEGFCVKTIGDSVFIVGKDDAGTRYGVNAFLEKHCGIRWFMPGELGEVVPKMSTLTVSAIDDAENPDFIHRNVWWAYSRFPPGAKEAYALWQTRNRMGGVKLSVGHNMMRIVPRARFYQIHPEYFPLINGLRRCENEGDNWQPCTSNPAVVRLAVEAAINYFEKNPDAYSFSVSPNDGYGWCMCPACVALDPPEYRADSMRGKGRRVLSFANAVAEQVSKKHPDRYIAFYAYAGTVEPPSDVKAHANVVAALAHYGWCGCNFHPIESPECPANEKFRPIVEGWGRITDKLFIREYFLTLANVGNSLMRIAAAHSIAKDIPYFKRHNVIGINSESVREYGIGALNFYVAARYMWNAATNEAALLDDYYAKFYGPASVPMRRYFEAVADYARANIHMKGPKFPPETMDQWRSLLDEAAKAAGGADPACAERVKMARDYFDFFHLGLESLGPKATKETVRAYFARAEELKDTNIVEHNLFARRVGQRPALNVPKEALYAGERLAPCAQTDAAPEATSFPALRGFHAFWVMLKEGENLRAEITNRRIGSYFDSIAYGVFGPDGREMARGEVEIFDAAKVAVKAEKAGVHALVVDSGSNVALVRIENGTAVLKGTLFHFLGAARKPLYFFVPKGLGEFQMMLEGEGVETGALDIVDPDGKTAATGSTVPKGHVQLKVPVPDAAAGRIWSVVLKPAETGVTEDLKLSLDANLPPYLSPSPRRWYDAPRRWYDAPRR